MKANYPDLKFYENKELDYWTPQAFLDFGESEYNFSNAILTYHPKLSVLKNEPKENWLVKIKVYVDAYYKDHSKKIKEALKIADGGWERISPAFYQAVDVVFRNHPWPTGEYAGFISIFNCNPRFLNNKTFQAFYNLPDEIKQIAAHEMLHFIFFDFAAKYFPDLTEKDLWLTSELFNDVILTTPELVAATGESSPATYQSHQKFIPEASDIWKNSPNVSDFITRAIPKFRSVS